MAHPTAPIASPTPTFSKPVALRARHDGWTLDRQQRFVAALADLGSITAAAAVVRMSARSVYRLRDHPAGADFRAACDAVLAMPIAPPGPSLLEQAMARQIVSRSRAGLGARVGGKDAASAGVCTIDRPIPARALLRLLHRAETIAMKVARRTNSSPS